MAQTTNALLALLLLLPACAPPDDPATSSVASRLDGVWKLVMVETIAPNGEHFPRQPHESFLMFSDGHYSMNFAGGSAPAPYSAEQLQPTDAEKVARYNTLIVNAGRFEVSETLLTVRPDFALVPEFVGGLGEFDYTLSGDTLDLLWHTIESADAVPDPNTAVGVRFHYQWVRQ